MSPPGCASSTSARMAAVSARLRGSSGSSVRAWSSSSPLRRRDLDRRRVAAEPARHGERADCDGSTRSSRSASRAQVRSRSAPTQRQPARDQRLPERAIGAALLQRPRDAPRNAATVARRRPRSEPAESASSRAARLGQQQRVGLGLASRAEMGARSAPAVRRPGRAPCAGGPRRSWASRRAPPRRPRARGRGHARHRGGRARRGTARRSRRRAPASRPPWICSSASAIRRWRRARRSGLSAVVEGVADDRVGEVVGRARASVAEQTGSSASSSRRAGPPRRARSAVAGRRTRSRR